MIYQRVSIILLVTGMSVLVALPLRKNMGAVEKVFHSQIGRLISALDSLERGAATGAGPDELKRLFLNARLAYKGSSVFTDYFFPSLRRSINGPDLKYSDDDNPDDIREPHGFQVIERIIYADGNSDDLKKEIAALIETFKSIDGQPGLDHTFRDEQLFDALKASVIRMVSLGITGFDSPIALQSLQEAAAQMAGTENILRVLKDDEGARLVKNAGEYLGSAKDFNGFDRLAFIQQFAEPLYHHFTNVAVAAGSVPKNERRPLNPYAADLFSDSLFDISFFSPNDRYRATPLRISIGKALFYDTILSKAKRSCATCHQPDKGFTDGRKAPLAINSANLLHRNTPTLTAVAFQTKFFYDSRASTLENQLNSVVHNVDEMDGSLKESIERIRDHPVYHDQFRKAYPNDRNPVTEYNISNAISSYLRSLPVFNTRFDRYMRGQARLSPREKKGFNLFAGKAKCATCHYIPLFNGLVPPQFTETESEVLGVPSVNSRSTIDPDEGKFLFTRSEIHKHAFKTPTLRNVTKTAPYMHNGVFETLEEVLEFYNNGGGEGLRVHSDNQTLPSDSLHLSKREIKNIVAFLRTLDN